MRKWLTLLIIFHLLTFQQMIIAPTAHAYNVFQGYKRFGHVHYGTGQDGAKTVSSNPETITNSSATEPLVLNYTTLTINDNAELRLVSRCGAIVFVQGNCSQGNTASLITCRTDNSMAAPSEGIHTNISTISGGNKVTDTQWTPAAGGSGGAAVSPNANGNAGGTATNAPGGGGSGGARNSTGQSGAGAAGTCWGGGSGGGGQGANSVNASAGAANAGAGGAASAGGNGAASGGAGNTAGAGATAGTGTGVSSSQDGTGGHLWLVIGGTFTGGAGAAVRARGFDSGAVNNTNGAAATGGASAGGVVEIYVAGTVTHSGTVSVIGGTAGTATGNGGNQQTGGAGGAGAFRSSTIIVSTGP